MANEEHKERDISPKYMIVPLSMIEIHPRVQRTTFRRTHSEKIRDHFMWSKFGVISLVVSEIHANNRHRKYQCFDGQHRLWAANELFTGETTVPALVYPYGTPDKELAGICIDVTGTGRRNWTPIELFFQRVINEEWKALAIHGTLFQLGLKVLNRNADGYVRAVRAYDWVIDRVGQAGFERVIWIVYKAWGKDKEGYTSAIVKGLALVCLRHGRDFKDVDMADKLSKTAGPGYVQGKIKDRAVTNRQTTAEAAAGYFINTYNYKRSTTRLDPQRRRPRKGS